MRRRTIAITILVAGLTMVTGIAEYRHQVYRGVPSAIRQEITSSYRGRGISEFTWRAYRLEDYTGWTPPGDRVDSVVTQFEEPLLKDQVCEITRIVTSGKRRLIRSWQFPHDPEWSANFDYTLHDDPDPAKQRPYLQFAFGFADPRVVRIKALTEDGRSTETRPFDGFWWMTGNLDPADYVVDRWDTVLALDAQGNVVFREEHCQIHYPHLECEDSQVAPQP